MKNLILVVLVLVVFAGCASQKLTMQPKSVILNIDSETPVVVSIYKSCDGNWNFCDDYRNYNFRKWERIEK